MKRFLALALALTMVLGMSAIASAEGTTGLKVFRYSVSTEPTTLDQTKGNSIGDNELMHAMQDGLVRNLGGEIKPGIAQSWEISDDGLVYTFHLREAYWSDGVQITANDFVYGAQRLVDPATASPYAFIGEHLKNGLEVETGKLPVGDLGIKAIDDMTVEITINNPEAYFLSLLGTCCQYAPVRKDLVEQYGTDFAATAEKNVYSGPFKLVSNHNQQFIFEKNEMYWDAASVNFDRVEVSVVTDTNTALAMYNAGDLDYVTVPNTQVALYDDIDHSFVNGNEDFVYINHAKEGSIVQNKNFRLALNYAVDRETYNILANNNVYKPWNAIVMPLVAGVNGTYGDEYDVTGKSYPMAGDAEKAKEYLAKAMEEEGIANASDITIEYVTTDHETNKKIAEVLQEMWQSTLGIKIDIRQVTYSEIYGNVFPEGDFEIGYGGWGPDYSDPYTYLELFNGGGGDYAKYRDEQVAALLEGSRTETDAQKRMDMLNQAELLLLEDGANIPLQLREVHYLIDEDVTGVVFYFCAINIDWAYGDCAPTAE